MTTLTTQQAADTLQALRNQYALKLSDQQHDALQLAIDTLDRRTLATLPGVGAVSYPVSLDDLQRSAQALRGGHPEHDHCADACTLDTSHDGACLDSRGRTACTATQHVQEDDDEHSGADCTDDDCDLHDEETAPCECGCTGPDGDDIAPCRW